MTRYQDSLPWPDAASLEAAGYQRLEHIVDGVSRPDITTTVEWLQACGLDLAPDGGAPMPEPTRTIKVPPAFHDDHVDRDLPAGTEVRRTKAAVWIQATEEDIAELRSDAAYYADAGTEVFGREYAGLISSARATVKAIDRQA